MLQIRFDRLVQRITGWAGIIIFTICSFNIAAFECYSDEISIINLLPSNEEKVSITQGVWGNVLYWKGDFQPKVTDPDVPYLKTENDGKITPVIREIYFFKPTNIQILTSTPAYTPFYLYIPTEYVAKTRSDSSGFYQITLPPGNYSVFVKENDKYYANRGDGYGQINPVKVTQDSVTKLQIDIQHQAAF